MNFYLKRKERIILTAIEIMDELGFQGLSTKEICKRQGVSEGALYKHFKSKDDVILGVLEFYSKFDDDIKETVALKELSGKDSILYFIERYAEYYESYPAITAIINSQEVLKQESGEIKNKIIEIFKFRTNFIIEQIEKGKKAGQIYSVLDSTLLSDVVLGTMNNIILRWRLADNNFPLKENITMTLNFILKSF